MPGKIFLFFLRGVPTGAPAVASPAEMPSQRAAWEYSSGSSGGRRRHPQPPRAPSWRSLGSSSLEGVGQLLSPSTPTATVFPGPFYPQGLHAQMPIEAESNVREQHRWMFEATGMGGACGKLRNKCSPATHTWGTNLVNGCYSEMQQWRPSCAKSPDISKEVIN